MIAVLNHLELQPDTDWESLGKKFEIVSRGVV